MVFWLVTGKNPYRWFLFMHEAFIWFTITCNWSSPVVPGNNLYIDDMGTYPSSHHVSWPSSTLLMCDVSTHRSSPFLLAPHPCPGQLSPSSLLSSLNPSPGSIPIIHWWLMYDVGTYPSSPLFLWTLVHPSPSSLAVTWNSSPSSISIEPSVLAANNQFKSSNKRYCLQCKFQYFIKILTL